MPIIKSAEELQNWGETYAKKNLTTGDIVLVHGEMGAGKTTLAKGIAKGIGIEQNITSPTFSKLNIYSGTNCFYHIDFYNVETTEELEDLGIYDFVEPVDGICYIEWPQKFPEVLPHRAHIIKLSAVDEGRNVEVEKRGME